MIEFYCVDTNMMMPPTDQNESLSQTSPSRDTLAWVIPNATVFVSSACIMVIELVAGRLIAKHLGSSIYTWTSVIGVVLAGIAIGNYIGGIIADRYAPKKILPILFMISAILAAMITLSDNVVGDMLWLGYFSWPVRVALHVALVFFLPSAMLGTISPVVAKMALDLGYRTGQTIGSVYAWGVVGSIVGTFATGFWLIAWFGTGAIIWGVAAVLATMAILYGKSSWSLWGSTGMILLLAVLANAPWSWAKSAGEAVYLRQLPGRNQIYSDESQYSYVQIDYLDRERNTRSMLLDHLLHSQIDMVNPTNLYYGYERACAAVTNRLSETNKILNTLTIGGGGYVFPRYLELMYPGSRTDVVEIDPAVTQAAYEAFGLPRDTTIRTFCEDGRVIVDRLARLRGTADAVDPYDFIYLDAVNDVTVPYQLTTLEYVRNIESLLTPEGGYLMNAMDVFDQGKFLGAIVKTFREVFPYVYVFSDGPSFQAIRSIRNTFIIGGLKTPLQTENLGLAYAPTCHIDVLAGSQLDDLVQRAGHRILTDDYAPVENLLAGVVRAGSKRHIDNERAEHHNQRAEELYAEGKFQEAIIELREALTLNPIYAAAAYNLGLASYRLQRFEEATVAFALAVSLNPDKLNAFYMLGNCYAQKGDYTQAKQNYRKVLEYNPHDAKAMDALQKVEQLEAIRSGANDTP